MSTKYTGGTCGHRKDIFCPSTKFMTVYTAVPLLVATLNKGHPL